MSSHTIQVTLVVLIAIAGCAEVDAGVPSEQAEIVQVGPSALLASSYVAIDLGTLGGSSSGATMINEAGQVVGHSIDALGRSRCFLYEGAGLIDLGTLGGLHCAARDINELGQIVGYSSTPSGEYHGFFWEAGVMTDLGTLAPYAVSVAWQINDAGLIFGALQQGMGGGNTSCVVWQGGVMQVIGTLGGNSCTPRALTESGVAVGASRPPLPPSGSWPEHVFRWDGALVDLGIAGEPSAVNEAEEIVGTTIPTTGFENRAFLISGGSFVDLGRSGVRSFAYDINENGVVVGSEIGGSGWVYTGGVRAALPYDAHRINDLDQIILNGASRGWLYEDGAMVEMPSVASNYSSALDLNDSGIVVGQIRVRNASTGVIEDHAALFRPDVVIVDSDGDGIPDESDSCPDDPGNDADADGICFATDNCPSVANSDQTNTDAAPDGGDACDGDDDDDGTGDATDNCPLAANAGQADHDQDGSGDACDSDGDGDGVEDGSDECLPSELGAIVGPDGCSLNDACPCDSPWKNHGAYVSCVARAGNRAVAEGWLSEAQRAEIVSQAATSSCGDKAK